MCGICGFWESRPDAESLAERMAQRLYHRGPDGHGIWHDAETGCTLAHRRLSILDLSPAGRQPMESVDGRYVISFNGEIYNHLELRALLEKRGSRAWKGHSDTETLVECISAWGLEETLRQSRGMFAIALWDRREHKLYLARDRMGEKPLYWGKLGSAFVFTSELKALREHPAWTGEIDRDVLALFFRHNYIPGPHSIFRGIHKLPPGTFLVISRNGKEVSEPRSYWALKETVEAGLCNPFTGSDSEAVDTLDHLLRQAVGEQMISDVPLGAFLSGGYDSSAIVALMQAQSSRPVRTFSIGFHEKEYDEAKHARAVARHLGTEHTELYVTPREAMGVIPELPRIWDEPFSDSSQIPTLLLARMTRAQVTVSLSGDAGDELFCGYGRYELGNRVWPGISRVPRLLRELGGGIAEHLGSRFSAKWKSRGALMRARDGKAFYRLLVSHQRHPEQLVIGSKEPQYLLTTPSLHPETRGFLETMMYLDSMTYLPDDVLVKVDRAAMAVSLETRVPLLDPRVIDFAWRLPLHMKYRRGDTKWVLRELVHRYIPRPIMERPKMGFGVPIDTWLRGPLKEWAYELITEKRLREEGYLNPGMVSRMWKEHLSGTRSWPGHLWDILMFQAWLEALRREPG